MFIEFHDNPDWILLNDPNETHNVRVVQVFHEIYNIWINTDQLNKAFA